MNIDTEFLKRILANRIHEYITNNNTFGYSEIFPSNARLV